MNNHISRRSFLKSTGWVAGGLTIVSVSGCSLVPPLPAFGPSKPEDVRTWVQLQHNGVVRFYLPRAELGQGISTGLSQVVAEELGVSIGQIDCQYQHTGVMAPCQMTVGSQSIENYSELVALAAASLREQLRVRAAKKLAVGADELKLDDGGFSSTTGKYVAYPELLDDSEQVVFIGEQIETPKLLSQGTSNFKVIGRSVEPVHIRRIVTGTETYSRDVTLPNMAFGAVAKPPQLGADVVSFDRPAALKVDGVIAVAVGPEGYPGVVAETPQAAEAGRSALAVRWRSLSDDELAHVQTVLDIDEAIMDGLLDHDMDEAGSLESAKASANASLSLRYDTPMAAHACMEPRSGVAHWQKDANGKLIGEVWTGSQDPWLIQKFAARVGDVADDQVVVRNLRVGGGFGGRVLCQASVEAAWLAVAVDRPVKVQWSREEDLRYNYVGPQFSTRIDAGLDDTGKLSYWHHQMVGSPILTSSMLIPKNLHWAANLVADGGTSRGLEMSYDVPNRKISFGDVRLPMPTGAWRGLGAAPNAFAVESAIDELSIAAEDDPIEFRLAMSKLPRMSGVLQRLRQLIADESDRESLGIAATAYKGVTFVAVAARVENRDGKIRVTKLWCAHDCGLVISPDQVKAQIEGNLVWGISMALHENFYLEGGIAKTDNFDNYSIARNHEVPDFVIDLGDSKESPSGAGEAAFPPTAAAIVNAVARVTGTRHRQLPIYASS